MHPALNTDIVEPRKAQTVRAATNFRRQNSNFETGLKVNVKVTAAGFT